MTNKKFLSQYWKTVSVLLMALILAATIPISPLAAAFEPALAHARTQAEQILPNDFHVNADPANLAGQSSTRAIGCSQADLIAAINAANASPGAAVIELHPGCVYRVTTIDNVNPAFRYNGFPVITSKITINGNGARITAGSTDIRAFQVAAGGELILNAVNIDAFNINVEGSVVVNLGKLTVNHSSFYNNQGRKGGAVYNEGDALFVNSTLANNFSCCCREFAYGGAIYNSGTLELVNSTLSKNRATMEGQSIYNLEGTVLLKNTIITTTFRGDNCSGTPVTDGGGNLRWPSGDTSCVGLHGDPKLGNLGDNGGLTKTLAILPGSKALDAGDNVICAAAPVNNTSQNGVTRPHGPACDTGSFELEYLVVLSITRRDPNPTNANTVSFTVTFSQPVTGVDLSDFALTTSGIEGASLISVTGSGAVYIVTVNTGTNSGTLRLDVIDDDSIKDNLGHPLGTVGIGNGNFTTGEVYTVDKEPPIVESITRVNASPTQAAYVAFLVTFSEPVNGVDLSDFMLVVDGLTDTIILSILPESDLSYLVNVSTGVGSGTIRLDLIDNDSITDPAGNPLGGVGLVNGDFTTGEVYIIDRTPPQVSSITRLDENPTYKDSVSFQVNFTEPVTGVEISDFSLHTDHLVQIEITAISGAGVEYVVSVKTGFGVGILRLDVIDDDSIKDLALNPLGGPGLNNGNFTTGEAYTITRPLDAPLSVDDSYETEINQALVIEAPGVLSNDIDFSGRTLIALLQTDLPDGEGTLTLNPDGSFTYTPPEDWTGTTTFTYMACYEDEPTECSAPATVTIAVRPEKQVYFNFIPMFFKPE